MFLTIGKLKLKKQQKCLSFMQCFATLFCEKFFNLLINFQSFKIKQFPKTNPFQTNKVLWKQP